jgi:hypothetical protein
MSLQVACHEEGGCGSAKDIIRRREICYTVVMTRRKTSLPDLLVLLLWLLVLYLVYLSNPSQFFAATDELHDILPLL